MNYNLNGPSFGRAWYSDVTRNEKRNGSDEIDLFELFLRIILLVGRYKTLIVSVSALSICLGFVWFAITPLRHEGQLICQVHGLEKPLIHQMFSAISRQDGKIFKELDGLSSLTLVDGEMANGTFVVSASVNDPAQLSALRKIIVDYFESNEYVRSATRQERDRINSTILALEMEEQRLASAIEQVVLVPAPQGESQSIADLSKLKMDFYRERLSLEKQLNNIACISVIEDFSKTTRQIGKSAMMHVIISLAGGFIITAMIIFIREAKRMIKENRDCLKMPSM